MSGLPALWLRPYQSSARDIRLDIAWLLGIALLLVATGLGLRDPWPADEPRFALIARDMVTSGDWLVPRVGGDLYADKPPLYFWLIAIGLAATGSLRASFLLPSLLSAIGCVLIVYDLARRLWSREVGLLAGTLLLLTVQFVWQARQAQIDATLCFFTTLSLYGLLRHLLLGPEFRWYAVGWAAAGFGVITKGVGFLPLLVLLPYWLLRVRWRLPTRDWSVWRMLVGPLAFLAAVGAWLVPMLLITQGRSDLAAYRSEILFVQTAGRYANAWHHLEPVWYFIVEVVPLLWLPLIALLPWLAPRWRDAWRAHDLRVALPLSWAILVLLFFSLSTGKRGVYILPAVPAFVLACAPYVPELLGKRGVRAVLFGISAAVGLVCALLAAYLFVDASRRAELAVAYGFDALTPALAIATLVLALCVAARRRRGYLAYSGALASVLLVVSFWVNPALNDVRSGARFVRQLEHAADPDKALGLLAFREEHLLNLDRGIVHFGHARWREWEQEAFDAARWLNAKPQRQLMVDGRARDHCFSQAQATPLGHANRKEWFLIEGLAEKSCAARGDAGAAQVYRPAHIQSRIVRPRS